MVTFYDRNGEKVNSNNKLIENIIELQTLNNRSEKRMKKALAKMDIDGLNRKLLQDTEKILEGMKV